MVRLYGNTYPVKDILKAECAARWNPEQKAWFVPANNVLIAMAIIERGCNADTFYGR